MRRGCLGNVTPDENIVRNLSQSNPDLFLEVVTKDTTSIVALRLFFCLSVKFLTMINTFTSF